MSRIGLFAGSFDPPTLGHLDVMRRALRFVDRLVVGIGTNADKAAWLEPGLRLELLKQTVPERVEVRLLDGLAVTAAREVGAAILVRGVRASGDLSAELQMARANHCLDEEIETVLIPSSPDTAHISSRLVREVHRCGGDVSAFVPAAVAQALAERRTA